MKKLIVAYILMLLMTLFANVATVTAARSDTKTPETVIQEFYEWYIVAVDGGTDPMKGSRTTHKKYVTLRLIKQIERDGKDYDEFLQTQEWDKVMGKCRNSFKIKRQGSNGDSYRNIWHRELSACRGDARQSSRYMEN